jgi:hypothetical protein
MANRMYDKGREAIAGSLDLSSATIKGVLVDSGAYTPDTATHQFLSDVPAGARIATSGALTSKTLTAGVFDAADTVFTAVSGVQSEYVILYEDTGAAGTSRLIAIIDTATGLPVTPNGGDITVTWDNGANKIFKL